MVLALWLGGVHSHDHERIHSVPATRASTVTTATTITAVVLSVACKHTKVHSHEHSSRAGVAAVLDKRKANKEAASRGKACLSGIVR